MHRTLLLLLVGAILGMSAMALAVRGEQAKGKVQLRTVSQREITEKLDGKETTATVVEVTMGPGVGSAPHRHAGPVFGYVLEGEYEWGLNDKPVRKLKVGDTFYEPTGSLHRVSRNPSTKGRTRVLAVILHPKDAKQITTPEPSKK